MFLVSKEFTFDAAHKLIHYHGKCERLHGHTYRLRVTIKGEKDEEGMVIDFALLKKIVQKKVISVLDHSYLNDIIDQPSAENAAEWIWNQIEYLLDTPTHYLYEIMLWETPTSFVIYRKDLSDKIHHSGTSYR